MNVSEQKEFLNKICLLAKDGNELAKKYLKNNFSLKVWTIEEIKSINYLKRFLMQDNERTVTYPKEDTYLIFEVGIYGDKVKGKLNWIEDIGNGFFLSGVTWKQSGSDFDGGSNVWMLKLDPEVGFIPMFNTSTGPIEIQERVKDLNKKEDK